MDFVLLFDGYAARHGDTAWPRQRMLHECLRAAIREGTLAAGTRLAPSRALAEELGVARNTVLYAYEQLASEGFVTTDRRVYMLELRSGEKPYMPAVSWSYPQPAGGGRQAVPATPVIPVVTARNYRYGLTGSSNPPWKPVAVYDDGRRVYVEFPRGIVQGEMPPIFVLGTNGEPQNVNSRVHQNVLIVDRLFGAAELRLGSGNRQQVVRIVRTNPTQAAAEPASTTTGGSSS